MSAYGTKKYGGDVAVQLTFPEVFSAAVAVTDPNPYDYMLHPAQQFYHPEAANDLQQDYHAEKKAAADRSVATRISSREYSKWLLNHNTYGYTQPRPVLGQRIFANPSNGNTVDIYPARRTMAAGNTHTGDSPIKCSSTGLQGGIVRTEEGQRYVMKLRMDRINQLNAIQSGTPTVPDQALRPGGDYSQTVDTEEQQSATDAQKLELKGYLDRIFNEYSENRSVTGLFPVMTIKSISENLTKAALLLFRVVINLDRYDFNELLNYVERTYQLARRALGDRLPGPDESFERFNLQEQMTETLRRLLVYVENMFDAMDRSVNEKKLLSASLIKTLKLSGISVPEFVSPDLGRPSEDLLPTKEDKKARELARDMSQDPEVFEQVKAEFREGKRGPSRMPFYRLKALAIALFIDTAGMKYAQLKTAVKEALAAERFQAAPRPATREGMDVGIPSPQEERQVIPSEGQKEGTLVIPKWSKQNSYKTGDFVYDESDLPAQPGDTIRVGVRKVLYRATQDLTSQQNTRPAPTVANPNRKWDIITDPYEPAPAGSGRRRGGKASLKERLSDKKSEEKEIASGVNDNSRLNPRAFNTRVRFDTDQRIKFGDSQGAYLGEGIGEQVPLQPVPIPVTPDGEFVRPNSGYVRPTFPRFRQAKEKPKNTMAAKEYKRQAALPQFQNSQSPPQLGIFAAQRLQTPQTVLTQPRAAFSFIGGRKGLPKTREGFVELAAKLKGMGHPIRVNSGSDLKNIRANFIRRLGL